MICGKHGDVICVEMICGKHGDVICVQMIWVTTPDPTLSDLT